MNIQIDLTGESLDAAILQLEQYRDSLEDKCRRLCERLATLGAMSASLAFSRAAYDGPNDVTVSVEQRGNGYSILANGEAVLFIEFGAGDRYGWGHPAADQFRYGPGTYPGKGHWDDPKGWILPADKGGGRSWGNPPAQAMYDTAQNLIPEIQRIAEEVFRS